MNKILLIICLAYLHLNAYEIEVDKTLKLKTDKKSNSNTSLFRDNEKQVVLDSSTNLMWQDNEESKNTKRSFDGAKKYCEDLNLSTYTDWSLPTIKQLETISSYDSDFKAYMDGFENFKRDSYWSSTPSAILSSFVWFLDFKFGYSSYDGNKNEYYVRCVRKVN